MKMVTVTVRTRMLSDTGRAPGLPPRSCSRPQVLTSCSRSPLTCHRRRLAASVPRPVVRRTRTVHRS